MRTKLVLVALLVSAAACGSRTKPSETAPSGPPAAAGPSAEAEAAPSRDEQPAGTGVHETVATADAPARYVLHVVDVGTGLAVFVKGPDFTLVYDAGSNDDRAVGDKNRFTAYLRATDPQLQAIDHVILSHPHRDHVELLPDVITEYKVAHVWDSGAINPICGYRRFVQAIADSSGTAYHSGAREAGQRRLDFGATVCSLAQRQNLLHAGRIEEGKKVPVGAEASITFLHVDGETHSDGFNENSLVALLELSGTRVLFMGDAEAGGRSSPADEPAADSIEGYLLATYPQLIDADVLIAGHHGSKTSSRHKFVSAVSPQLSVISSGPTRYGSVTLPDQDVVDELDAAGELYRTDVEDESCRQEGAKIGPDADGKPGGCTHVQIEVVGTKVSARLVALSD